MAKSQLLNHPYNSRKPTATRKWAKALETKGSKFITTKNITIGIREALRPRFKWRPYMLRTYFDTN